MLEKLNAYFSAAFVRHPVDYEAALKFRSASRWWLDFFRNLVVVSTVSYLADRSDSTVLKIFSGVYFFALTTFMISHFNNWSFRFLPNIKNPKTNLWVNGLVWTVLATAVMIGCLIALGSVMKSLAVLQPR